VRHEWLREPSSVRTRMSPFVQFATFGRDVIMTLAP
jgi:hypothetical protein